METKHIDLPNRPDSFLLMQLRDRLQEGEKVHVIFGGISMQPLISGTGDSIELEPLKADEPCRVGDVYLFLFCGHHIVHRLMRIKGDEYLFRGDNCYRCEQVRRKDILARLISVHHPDGTSISCDSDTWHRRSKVVVRRRNVKNILIRCLNRKSRKVYSIVYFICLAVLMWAPLGGLGIPLDNFVFGIRADHLLHASIYLLCPVMLMDAMKGRKVWILLGAIAMGILTESVQYLLPYRGFDINDLVANFLGCLIGWVALLPYLHRKARMSVSPSTR